MNVLIRNESDAGKELIAKAIHDNPLRSGIRIINLSYAALPENFLEIRIRRS
ncbi:MAG: sigma 54-interacting transcriptional regulator [Hyphomicrobiaceae bacterium]|nr:sigma 54-interacting transcriptional regulator [Hyphomicrobiaceae bacterium]